MTIPQLIVRKQPSSSSVGPHRPKATATTPGLTEAVQQVWEHPQVRAAFGVWECTPGRFTARRDGYAEICHILEGEVTMHTEGAPSVSFGPGDAVVMPSGWRGEWEVHSRLRKLYITVPDA